MRRRKLVAANARRRFKISAFCIGGQFLAAISSAAISEAAYCGDPVSTMGMTEMIFFWIDPRVKVNGQYYCNVLLSQQMLPAIKRVAERCVFTKQYVAYSEICHFLCSAISQCKVIALDRWGGKWNHLSMTPRLTTEYAKNYCNRTLIVKVIVDKKAVLPQGNRAMPQVFFSIEVRQQHSLQV